MEFDRSGSPARRLGPEDAVRMLEIYGSELAWLAAAATDAYPDLVPAGVICERGTTEADSLLAQRSPRLPIRETEDGTCLAVITRKSLFDLVTVLGQGEDEWLHDPRVSGPGRMPILAVFHAGARGTGVDFPPS